MTKMALTLLQSETGHQWTAEHKFCERRWRFDFACESLKIAIEVEGGAWTRGRHTRGTGFISDMLKYNRAATMGWRVLRYTPEQFSGGEWVGDLRSMH
jgi:very-short-patch-repair endonuclease